MCTYFFIFIYLFVLLFASWDSTGSMFSALLCFTGGGGLGEVKCTAQTDGRTDGWEMYVSKALRLACGVRMRRGEGGEREGRGRGKGGGSWGGEGKYGVWEFCWVVGL